MIIPLAEWLPDLPPLNNPGALVATNVIPARNSYESFPGANQAGIGGIGRVQGAIFARDTAANVYTYVGDASALYVQSGLSFTSTTRLVGGAYTTGIDDFWEFVNWGNTVIGVNGHTDLPQQITLGGLNFSSMPASMPKARHIATIKDFIVLGNVSDSATQVQRIRWSGINNSAAWSVDATTLADFQDLPGNGGWVQKIISGEQGYVFQERAIWRMTFVGSPLIFQFDKIHDGIGAYAPQSVVNYENLIFFLANDGFKSFDGSNIKDIGKGKVDNTFLDDLDTNYVYRVTGLVVPEKKIVMWPYPGASNTSGNANHIMIYSWAYDRWARVDGVNIEYMATSASPGYTLDGLDAVSTNIDTLAYSLDSRQWTGGQLNMSYYQGGKLYYLNATPMSATVQTSEVNLMNDTTATRGTLQHKAMVTGVWPIVQGLSASVTVAIGMRNKVVNSLSTTTALTPTSAGFVQCRATANLHRFTINVGGAYDNIQGVDVEFSDAGRR